MTEPQTNQPPYQGISGPGGNYAPVQDQMPYGAQAQNPYGQAPQSPYGQPPQNPYGQAPQNPYGQPPQNPYGVGSPQNFGPAPKPKRKFTFLRVRLIVLVVVLAIGGIGAVVKNMHKADRNSNGDISKKGTLDAISLKVGDCFQDPDSKTSISSVTAVPCAQGHTSQIFATVPFPNPPALAPSGQEVKDAVQDACDQAAQNKLDQSKTPQDARLEYFWSQGADWSSNHNVMCAVHFDSPFSQDARK